MPVPLSDLDIDTLPDGAAIISDAELLSISAEAELPTRRPFDEEPTRKALAPKPPPRTREAEETVDLSSWDTAFKDTSEN